MVQQHQFARQILDVRLHLLPRLLPCGYIAQFIQFRFVLAVAAARILHDLVQVLHEYVELAALIVGDLDVVALDALVFLAGNAAVDAQAVLLVHDVVANGQLGQVADLLSFILRLLPLHAALLPHHITLGDQHELHLRVRKAAMQASDRHADLARVDLFRRRLFKVRQQILLRELVRKSHGPRLGTAQKHDAELLFMIFCEILKQDLLSVFIGMDGLHMEGDRMVNETARRRIQRAHADRRRPVQPPLHRFFLMQKPRLSRKEVALLQTVFHTLQIFRFDPRGALADQLRLVDDPLYIRLFEEVREMQFLRQEERDVGIHLGECRQVLHLLDEPQRVVTRRRSGRRRIGLLLNRRQALLHLLLAQHIFGRGKDPRFLQRQDRPLALGVKTAKRVDLIAPELHSDGIFRGQ